MDMFCIYFGTILIFTAIIGSMLGIFGLICNILIDKFWGLDTFINNFFADVDENGNKLPFSDFLIP